MCVICYVPKGNCLPSKKDLGAMWDANPHGAGLMWLQDGEVFIKKGYFLFDKFYEDLQLIKQKDVDVAIHMRIATSGGINKAMCHPFAITNEIEELKMSRNITDCAMMHNGIIPINITRNDINDTCEYIIDNLYPRYKYDNSFFKNESEKMIMEYEINGSRLLFFSKEGIEMIGSWNLLNGCYFSNMHWIHRHTFRI